MIYGGYPQFTPLPLGNFARLPPGSSSVPILHSGMYPWVENCTEWKKSFSNQHNKIIQPVLVCVPMGPVVRMLAITHLVIFLP